MSFEPSSGYPGNAGAAYGYASMGPYSGGQAELLRAPYADSNCLVLPADAAEKANDYVRCAQGRMDQGGA
jgi:threonine dehydrogenase-like Zn-dependent dehydrogenase